MQPDARVEAYANAPDAPYQKPDEQATKDAWVQSIRIAEKKGYKTHTVKAVTRRQHEQARIQQHALSRISFTVPDTSHIDWTRKPSQEETFENEVLGEIFGGAHRNG